MSTRPTPPSGGTPRIGQGLQRVRSPTAQLWVVATLYDTANVTVIGRSTARSTPARPMRCTATTRDSAPPCSFPRTSGRRTGPRLAATGTNRWLPPGRRRRHPGGARPAVPEAGTALWYRAVIPPARFLTAGFLPDRLRQDFGLPWNDRHERRFHRTMRMLSLTYPRLPRGIRHGLKDYLLGELDKDIRRNSRSAKRQRSQCVVPPRLSSGSTRVPAASWPPLLPTAPSQAHGVRGFRPQTGLGLHLRGGPPGRCSWRPASGTRTARHWPATTS